MDFPRNFIPIQKRAWALGTRLGYKRKDQPITNPCSVKGKLRTKALCYKKSALNNCALCITRSRWSWGPDITLLMGSLLHMH